MAIWGISVRSSATTSPRASVTKPPPVVAPTEHVAGTVSGLAESTGGTSVAVTSVWPRSGEQMASAVRDYFAAVGKASLAYTVTSVSAGSMPIDPITGTDVIGSLMK